MEEPKTTRKKPVEPEDDLYEEDDLLEEEEDLLAEEDKHARSEGGGGFRILVGLMAAVLIFGVGLAAGALYMRQRDRQNEVLATINGTEITKNDFFHRMEVADGANVMHLMANEILQHQFAQQEGVLPKDAEVEAKYKQTSSQPNFAQTLFKTRQNDADVKRDILTKLTQNAILTKGVTVTDAEIQQFYNYNADHRNPNARYYLPETIRIGVVVTPTKAEADKAYAALKGGQPFDTVVKLYSKDPSAQNGGILPPLRRGQTNLRQMPGLEEAVFSTKPGDVLPPRQVGQNQWWVVRCIEKQQESVVPFDKVRDEAQIGAMLVKGMTLNGKKTQADFEKFQQTANVKVFWPQYTDSITPKKPEAK
jgi:foldase protein PrsA